MMKIFAYGVSEEEIKFFNEGAHRFGVDIKTCKENPTLENAQLAQGYPCVSMLPTYCPEEVLVKFYQGGVRFLSQRTQNCGDMDFSVAQNLGLQVGCASCSSESVAEYTVMSILMALRKMKLIMKSCEVQDYSLTHIKGANIRGKVVGIIGINEVAKYVIQQLVGFDCNILAYDPKGKKEKIKNVTYTDLMTLYKKSDIITIHMPSNQSAIHMMDKKAFQQMKDNVVFVNTSASEVVDTKALLDAIVHEKIGAAVIDTFEEEHSIYSNNLKGSVMKELDFVLLSSFPNVIVTPHIAYYTNDSIRSFVLTSIQSCCAFMKAEENPWLCF